MSYGRCPDVHEMYALTCVPRQRHPRHGLLLTNAKIVSVKRSFVEVKSSTVSSNNPKQHSKAETH